MASNGGVNVGGMFHVSNEAIMYGVTGIIGLAVVKSFLDRNKAGYYSQMGPNVVSYATQTVEERIAQRLAQIAQNSIAVTQRIDAIRAAIARYRNQIAAAIAAYIVKREAFKNKTITQAEFMQAVATLRTTIHAIIEQLVQEFSIPINLNLTQIGNPVNPPPPWKATDRPPQPLTHWGSNTA